MDLILATQIFMYFFNNKILQGSSIQLDYH